MKKIGNLLIVITSVCLIIFCFWLLSNMDYNILKDQTLYKILKDQGAIIGAVLAIFGVAWMVKSNNDMIIQTSSENKKSKAYECLVKAKSKFNKLNKASPDATLKSMYKKFDDDNFFDDISDEINYLRFYFKSNNYSCYLHTDVIISYMEYHDESELYDVSPYANFLFDKLKESIIDSYSQMKVGGKHFVVGITIINGDDEMLIKNSEDFIFAINNKTINGYNIMAFAQSHIDINILRLLINDLDKI